MPISEWFPSLLTCLHWPFCPGVFIAILGLVAAIVTFWKDPPRLVKVISILLFTVLLLGEIWMMGKDRDAHDKAEKKARQIEQNHFDVVATSLNQQYTATQAAIKLENEVRESEKKHSTAQLAQLRQQQQATDKLSINASRDLLLTVAPRIRDQLQDIYNQWNTADTTARHRTPKGRYDPEYLSQLAAQEKQYAEQLKPILTSAKSVREQLINTMPPEVKSKYEYPPVYSMLRLILFISMTSTKR